MKLSKSILDQLPALKEWRRPDGSASELALFDYVGFVATPDMFFAFSDLMCPETVEHEGGVFLANQFSVEAFNSWKENGTGLVETQRVMNHVHISSLMQNQEVADDVAIEAARHLAHIWNRTLGGQDIVAEAFGSDFTDAAATFARRST